MPIEGGSVKPVILTDSEGRPTDVPIRQSDIQIGAVEIKSAATETRAEVTADGLEVADLALRLVPNGTQTDQALTVDATVGGVQFTAFHALTTYVLITCETAQIRFTLDGSAPTATNGHIMEAGDVAIWRKEMASAAKFIRTGGTSAVLSASQLIVA